LENFFKSNFLNDFVSVRILEKKGVNFIFQKTVDELIGTDKIEKVRIDEEVLII